MNNIFLKGVITNIRESHTINNVVYDKADLIVKRSDGKEDLLVLEFKKFSNNYKEGQEIILKGNIRSYSRPLENGKNKVDIFVFSYLDPIPEADMLPENINTGDIDGRICKISDLIILPDGKEKAQFILANNIIINNNGKTKKLNSYIPCIAFGSLAKSIISYGINTRLQLQGELHSRQFKKYLTQGDENNPPEIEIRLAHEFIVKDLKVLDQ